MYTQSNGLFPQPSSQVTWTDGVDRYLDSLNNRIDYINTQRDRYQKRILLVRK